MATQAVVVQVSVNGGAWSSGPVTVTGGQTVNFRIQNTFGIVQTAIWEFPDAPPGFSVPTGWTSINGVITASGLTPTGITIPANGMTTWGKYPVRLRVNGNPVSIDPVTDAKNGYNPSFTDTATVLIMVSPVLGLGGTFFGEQGQVDPMRQSIGALMSDLRKVDASTGGLGVVALNQDVIVTNPSTGAAKTLGFANVPIDLTAPLAQQVQTMQTSGTYALRDVETVLHVDHFIHDISSSPTVTQTTTGIQNALNAFAALSIRVTTGSGGTAPELLFGPRIYYINKTLVCLNAYGGIIRGAGYLQSVIEPTMASGGVQNLAGLPMLQLLNCAFVTVQDLSFWMAPSSTTLTANASQGATTLQIASGSGIVNGQKIGLQNAAGTLAEVVTVSAGGGTGTITVGATRNAYSTGDTVMTCALTGVQIYKDASQPQEVGAPTHNRIKNVLVGSSGPAYELMLYGVTIDCAGGTGSSSDSNNDINLIEGLQVFGSPVAAVNIGHSQSLANVIRDCSLNGVYGVQTLTGGSWSLFGGTLGCSGIDFTFGGIMGRTCSVHGTVSSDSTSLWMEARTSDSMSVLDIEFFGYQKFSGGSGTNLKTANLTGSDFRVAVFGGEISFGFPPGTNTLYFKDTGGSSVGSLVSLNNVSLGVSSATADGVLVYYGAGTQWTANGGLTETTLNGGHFIGATAGQRGQALLAPYAFGQLFGHAIFENTLTTSASPYTAESSGFIEGRIRVDNTGGPMTHILPAPYRAGRRIIYEALAAGNVITFQPPTTTPASTINGNASLVWTPSVSHAELTMSLADTLSSGVLATWTCNVGGSGSGSALANIGITTLALTAGTNNNAGPVKNEMVVISAPVSGTASLTGLSPTTGAFATGQRIDLFFETPNVVWTLVHNNTGGGTSTYPFFLPDAANISFTPSTSGYATIRLRFDGTYLRLA